MIKNIIIIILILLLLIILYSYYCISNRMINFEKERLEYILQKEAQVKLKETKLDIIENCSKKNAQLINAFLNINKILQNINTTETNEINNVKTLDHVPTETNEINNVKILDHVPTEYIDKE